MESMRFNQPVITTATFKMTTSMFLGDANKKVDDKIFRASSFKGALRFWWRALNWAACLNKTQSNQQRALSELHKQEAILFGSANSNDIGSQGVFSLRINAEDLKKIETDKSEATEKTYLLGMGLVNHKTGFRQRLAPNSIITVNIIFKHNATEDQKKQVTQALQAIGFLGGLGARSRRGYGSLAIQSLETKGSDNSIVKTPVESIDDLKKFISSINCNAPLNSPLSTFTERSRIDISLQITPNDKRKNPSDELMTALNDAMQLYRGYGNKGKVGNQNALRLFKSDHDLVLNVINGKPLGELPQRTIFGLPHNYRYSEGGSASINAKLSGKEIRRASPLLTHIHEFPDGKFLAIQTFLGGQFLPKDSSVEIKTPKPKTFPNLDVNEQVIYGYLNFDNYFKNREVLLGDK